MEEREGAQEGAENAGERTAQEQQEGGFTNGEQPGPYGGSREPDEDAGHDRG